MIKIDTKPILNKYNPIIYTYAESDETLKAFDTQYKK